MTHVATYEAHLPLPEPVELVDDERRRAVGAVLGAAVGDALGAPFEFLPAGTYRQRFPEPLPDGASEMIGGGSFGWDPGAFTDDTQMGVVLAESLVERGGYDPDHVWQAFRAWGRHATDVGTTIRRSLAHADWRAVQRDTEHGAGNGALMRAFPLAVAYLEARDDDVRRVVLHQAALTHPDAAAGWGAWMAVEMMRFAIHEEDPLDELDALVADLPAEQRDVFGPLLAESWDPSQPSPHNGTVWGCLAQAVWALRTTVGYEQAVVEAVSLGDDADTVACVTGALAGAVYGVRAIPERWLAHVHGSITRPDGEVVTYRGQDLERLALRLLQTDR